MGVAGSLVLILLPLREKPFTSTQWLVIGVAITWFVLGVYIVGTIATRYAEVEEYHEPEVTQTALRSEHDRRSLRSFRSHNGNDLERRQSRHSHYTAHEPHEDDLAVL